MVVLLFVITASQTTVPPDERDDGNRTSLPTPGDAETSTWVLLGVGGDHALVADLGTGSSGTIILYGEQGEERGRWSGDPMRSRLVCDACPAAVVVVDDRVYRQSSDGLWAEGPPGDLGIWRGTSPAGVDVTASLSTVASVGEARLRAPEWPADQALTMGVRLAANYRPDVPNDGSLGSIGRGSDGTYIQVLPHGDPTKNHVQVAEQRAHGGGAMREIAVSSLDQVYACEAIGSARGVLVGDAAGGPELLWFPEGFDLPHRSLPVPSGPYNQCLVDAEGVTLWIGVTGTAVSEGDHVVFTDVARIEADVVAWERSVPVESVTGTVATAYDHRAGLLVAVPSIGSPSVIDPVTGDHVLSKPVAGQTFVQSEGGTWWMLGFDGVATTVPSLAGHR